MRPTDTTIHEYERDRDRILVVGIPTLGTVSVRWMVCVQGLKPPMNRPVHQSVVIGRAVADARNEIVAQMLALESPTGDRASHLLFIDDDVLLSQSALQQLYAADLPIVAGYYYAKADVPYPLILPEKLGGTLHPVPADTLLPCYAHGMGAALIRREVFEAMHAGGHVDVLDTKCNLCQGETCPGCCGTGRQVEWFRTTNEAQVDKADGGTHILSQTEDVFFCERAARAGYQPTVHTGVFGFHWAAALGEAYPREAWRAYRQGKPIDDVLRQLGQPAA